SLSEHWRRKAVNFKVSGEPWRALATSSLSEPAPRSATSSRL
ncbi:hypothetical protein A2U01_0101377, partial [Trifolium medium]|nr:hypothetical protein [Trifolium medium]